MPVDAHLPAARRLSLTAPGAAGPPAFLAQTLARLPGVTHAYFGRAGGVSGGIYASLNAGPGSADDPSAVTTNRARIAAAIGVGADRLLSAHQAHTARAVTVDAPFAGPKPEADALVTATPGLGLCVLAADCAPVLFADPEAGVIGAAHAGWKGALGGVLEATVAAMAALGARPDRTLAAIGPCIRQGSYEVGPEFEARFRAADPAAAALFKPGPGDRLRFDLPGFCRMALDRAGVRRVETLPFDTYGEPDVFFSARRAGHAGDPDYGRNASVIALAL